MFKEIPKTDISIRPFKVYKEWYVDNTEILPIFGKNITGTYFDASTDEKSGRFYKRIIYNSIKSQFYTNSATASLLTEVGKRKSYSSTDERVIGDDIAVLALPQSYYGEGIKIGSVTLINGLDTYNDDGYSNLIDTDNAIVGNIFYDRGLIVLTKYITSGSTLLNYTLNYRSTKTIYENEIFISVAENEFNVSTNPSAIYEDGGSTYVATLNDPYDASYTKTYQQDIHINGAKYIKTSTFPYTSSLNQNKFGSFDDYFYSSSVDPTGSYLAPYISTIGLYTDDNELVAIAKLPTPIKSLPDYPVNFIVRFDT